MRLLGGAAQAVGPTMNISAVNSAVSLAAAQSASRLTTEQLRQVQELATVDRKVHAHEQAHLAAAGPYASGGASFSYVTGPDGQRHAVAGEVPIDASPVPGDPEATLRKARAIQAAANAPVDPSSQDRQVAAQAAQSEARAQQELQEARQKSLEAGTPYDPSQVEGDHGVIGVPFSLVG